MPDYEEILEEEQVVVLPDGSIRVDYQARVLRDGVEISRRPVSESVMVWDEVPSDSRMSPETRAVVAAARTPERRAAGLARRPERG